MAIDLNMRIAHSLARHPEWQVHDILACVFEAKHKSGVDGREIALKAMQALWAFVTANTDRPVANELLDLMKEASENVQ